MEVLLLTGLVAGGAVMALAAAAGCSAHDSQAKTGVSSVPSSERSLGVSAPPAQPEGTIGVVPQRAQPGQVVSLHFSAHNRRGIAFSLDVFDCDSYVTRYYLIAPFGNGSTEPSWWSVEDPEGGLAWVDIGVGGPGPEWVTIPDDASPGLYRICTANAVRKVCGEVTIT